MFDKFVVHSGAEASRDTGNSFWSETAGWTNLVCASVFSVDELAAFSLSRTCGSDAILMPVAHAYDPSLCSLCDIYDIAPNDLLNGDGIEVQGVRDEGGTCEVSNEQPQFFSAYMHLRTGGCQCIGDFGSFKKAKAHADQVAEAHGWPVYSFVPERFTHA